MNTVVLRRLRWFAVTVGCCAAVVLVCLLADVTQRAQPFAADISDGAAITVSTPSSTPAITKAVPTITGPAPLYAGEAPDTNPQAQIP